MLPAVRSSSSASNDCVKTSNGADFHVIELTEATTSGLPHFSILDTWNRTKVVDAIIANRVKFPVMNATAAIQVRVKGQCESVNESNMGGEYDDGSGDSEASLPGKWGENVRW